MADVFNGPADTTLTDDEKTLHDNLKAKALELETLFDQVKVAD